MKRKEIRNLATKIAKYEKIIQNSNDKEAIKQAENEIMKVSSSVHSLEDMMAIDELVVEVLKEDI